jgi:hypothetical protein
MLLSGIAFDAHLLECVLTALLHSHSTVASHRAKEVFDQAIQSGVQPTVQLYNLLIQINGKDRSPSSINNAISYLQNMKERKLAPTVESYNIIISACGKARLQSKKTFAATSFRIEWLNNVDDSKPNKINIAPSNDYGANYHLCKAFEVFNMLIDDDLQPTVVTYSSLMSVLSSCKGDEVPALAQRIFEEMVRNGIEPNRVAWCNLIGIWSKSKLPNKEEVVENLFSRYGSSLCFVLILLFVVVVVEIVIFFYCCDYLWES